MCHKMWYLLLFALVDFASAACTSSTTPLSEDCSYEVCTGGVGGSIQLNKQDSYGDGWNSNTIVIGTTSYTLSSGSSGTDTISNPGTEIVIPLSLAVDGSYDSEVTWTVTCTGAPFTQIAPASGTGSSKSIGRGFGTYTNNCPGSVPPTCTSKTCPAGRIFLNDFCYPEGSQIQMVPVKNLPNEDGKNQYCNAGAHTLYTANTSLTRREAVHRCTEACSGYAGFSIGVKSDMDKCACRSYTYKTCPTPTEERLWNPSGAYEFYEYVPLPLSGNKLEYSPGNKADHSHQFCNHGGSSDSEGHFRAFDGFDNDNPGTDHNSRFQHCATQCLTKNGHVGADTAYQELDFWTKYDVSDITAISLDQRDASAGRCICWTGGPNADDTCIESTRTGGTFTFYPSGTSYEMWRVVPEVQGCSPGQKSDGDSCTDCAAGKYSSDGTACVDCDAGEYQDDTGQPSCKTCGGLNESPNADKTDCIDNTCVPSTSVLDTSCTYTTTSGGGTEGIQLVTICTDNYGWTTGFITINGEDYYQYPNEEIANLVQYPADVSSFPWLDVITYVRIHDLGFIDIETIQVQWYQYVEYNSWKLLCNGEEYYYYPELTTAEKAALSQPRSWYGKNVNNEGRGTGDPYAPCSEQGMVTHSVCPAGNVYYDNKCMQPCGDGKQRDGTECEDCAAGRFSSDGIACVDCGTGEYQDQTGQPSCVDCPSNSASTGTDCQCLDGFGGDECQECVAGQFSSGGDACETCPTGWYQDQAGQPLCEECPSNSESTGTGCQCLDGFDGDECQACAPGQFSSGGGACEVCPDGYGPISDKSSCEECEAGKVSSDVGCVLCSGYEYQDQVGQSTCKSCGANELSNGTSCHCIDGFGGSPCSACPAGKHSDDGECVSCGVGKYQDGSAQHECKDCASDSFVNEENTTCTKCPYNKSPNGWDVGCPAWSTNDGCHCDCGDSGFTGEHCDVCGYGKGFNASKCENCTEGRVNVENTHTAECAALGCDEGYGHTSDVTDRDWTNKVWDPDDTSTISGNCQLCPPGTYSPDDDGQCSAVICGENEYVSNHVCTPCDSPKVNDAGDDASLGDTECDYPCAPDQYYFLSQDLSLRRCYACPVGTRSDGGETQCWEPVTDANIHDAVGESSHYYGDIEDLDTSAVTNMDGLFKNKDVPDISNWDVSSVTSMREMFMNATNIPDTSEWDVANVDTFWWKKDNFTCPYLTGAKVNGRCQFTNRGLRNTVLAWENDESGTEELYGPLATWDVSYVTNMTELFKDSAKNPDIRNWDMSNVVYADRMFQGSSFQHLIDNKDLSSLQTAENMFDSNYGGRVCGKHLARAGAKTNIDHHGANGKDNCIVDSNINTIVASWFVDPNTATYGHIDSWDVSEVTSMSSLFKNKTFGEETLKHWDTSNVENMASMFENTNFNKDIGHWDVRKVHTFNKMFRNNDVFAHDISRWEVFMHEPVEMTGGDYFLNNVLQLDALFKKEITDIKTVYNNWKSNPTAVEEEYGLISEWMTHSVVNMSGLFMGEDFNEDISHWVVSSVTDMSSMFENSAFNRPIGGWSTVNVRDMSKMFKDSDFNHEIKLWDVQKVEDMTEMFMGAKFSRSIGDWDLFATIADEVQAPGGEGVCGEMSTSVNLTSERVSQAAIRDCYEHCDNLDDLTRNDIEGRNRIRSWGRLETQYTHFGIVTDELKEHTCRCMKNTYACANSPHDYVYKFRDMVTTDIFKDNTAYRQPLCGLGWRYRDLTSLADDQYNAETSCGICNPGEHISQCGLCMGEFQFDYCRDSPKTFTLQELYGFGDSHGMTGLVVDSSGVPLASDNDINNTGYINKHACNCEYEGDLRGCLVVNGRKQVRLTEWYVNGETVFTDNGRYYCELDFLNGREVRPVSGFGSVACTDDVLLDREECGLVGGEWDGSCSMCLAPCADPRTGVKEISVNRVCTPCPDAETVFNNECVACPDGKYTDGNHAWCGKCPAGTHGEGGTCDSCVDGMFAAFEGTIRCDTCDADTFSVGTECASCIDGYTPNEFQNGCDEANWCHRGTTAHGDHVGNYCESCDDGFELKYDTCVATCVHGEFVLGGDPDCVCHDMWSGTDCDTCSEDQFDFTYEIPPKCEDRPCSATLETDCLCVNEIVKDGRACIDFKIKEICEEGETDCMCDGEWTEEGICMGNEILLPCEGDFLHTREECFPGYRVNNFTCDTAPRPGGTCNGLCEESDYDSGEACCVPQPWLCENVCTDIEYSKIPQAGHIATSNDRGVCCTERQLCGDYKQCGDIDSSPKQNTNRDYFNTLRAATTFDDVEFLETCCYSFEYTTANSWFGQGCGSNTIETAAECDTAGGTWGSASAGDWRGHCLTTTTMSGVSVPANRCRK